MDKDNKERRFKINMTKGGKNLIILGAASVLVALVTTSVSLLIYHNSGDIYLDRSRPGYLPDENEVNNDDVEDDYDFSKVDELNLKAVEKYLEELKKETKAVDEIKTPFSEEALSDKGLGITE